MKYSEKKNSQCILPLNDRFNSYKRTRRHKVMNVWHCVYLCLNSFSLQLNNIFLSKKITEKKIIFMVPSNS